MADIDELDKVLVLLVKHGVTQCSFNDKGDIVGLNFGTQPQVATAPKQASAEPPKKETAISLVLRPEDYGQEKGGV